MQITDDDAFAFASSTRDFDARRDATTRAPIGRVDETRVRVDETRARGCDDGCDCTRLKRLHFSFFRVFTRETKDDDGDDARGSFFTVQVLE